MECNLILGVMAEDTTLKHKANGVIYFVVVNACFGTITAGINSEHAVNSVNSSKAIKPYSHNDSMY